MELNTLVSSSPHTTVITNLITASVGVCAEEKVFIVGLRVFLQPRNGDSLSARSRGADDLLNIKSLDVHTCTVPGGPLKTFSVHCSVRRQLLVKRIWEKNKSY